MSQNQVEERLQSFSEKIDKNVVFHLGNNPYTGLPTAILYSKDESVERAFDELLLSFEECKSCSLESSLMTDKEAEKLVKDAVKKWANRDYRLRCAEVIGTDTPEWEQFVRLMYDYKSFPRQIAVQLIEMLREEGKTDPNVTEYEDSFYIQLDLSQL